MFCKAKISKKKTFFLRGDFRLLPNKNVQFSDHFFPALFPQGFRISKHFGHPTSGSVGKIGLKMYHIKRDIKHTDRQTHRHADIATIRSNRPSGPILWKITAKKNGSSGLFYCYKMTNKIYKVWWLKFKKGILGTKIKTATLMWKKGRLLFCYRKTADFGPNQQIAVFFY